MIRYPFVEAMHEFVVPTHAQIQLANALQRLMLNAYVYTAPCPKLIGVSGMGKTYVVDVLTDIERPRYHAIDDAVEAPANRLPPEAPLGHPSTPIEVDDASALSGKCGEPAESRKSHGDPGQSSADPMP
jgi:hypothetical protein